MVMKRLFIMAGYDRNNMIPGSLVAYAKQLSVLGDVIVCLDCSCEKPECDKLKKYAKYVIAERHGEYDFGSYKIGYLFAKKQKLLSRYDYVYFVNDSVYCVDSPSAMIMAMENSGADFVGATCADNPIHIQSFFYGVSKKIVNKKFFDDFMCNISRQDNKQDIITKYEIGLSRLMLANNVSMYSYTQNEDIVHKPLLLLSMGVPLLKKSAVCYIGKIEYLRKYVIDDDLFNVITKEIIASGVRFIEYREIYRFSFLGIPLFSICVNIDDSAKKVKLFCKFTIIKTIRKNG